MGRPNILPAQRTDWETPRELFNELVRLFGPFDLDPCGAPGMYVSESCGSYYCEADNGLVLPWYGRVFMNPPYGKGLEHWVQTAVYEVDSRHADLVVALLPVRADRPWWQGYVRRAAITAEDLREPLLSLRANHQSARPTYRLADGVRFLPGRLKFVGAESSATFPSCVVVWRKP